MTFSLSTRKLLSRVKIAGGIRLRGWVSVWESSLASSSQSVLNKVSSRWLLNTCATDLLSYVFQQIFLRYGTRAAHARTEAKPRSSRCGGVCYSTGVRSSAHALNDLRPPCGKAITVAADDDRKLVPVPDLLGLTTQTMPPLVSFRKLQMNDSLWKEHMLFYLGFPFSRVYMYLFAVGTLRHLLTSRIAFSGVTGGKGVVSVPGFQSKHSYLGLPLETDRADRKPQQTDVAVNILNTPHCH
ncbi:hypothetical protein BaRGS_00011048 [Batillaria attramentaria]|uniref:Uncharacterized protein n=1 Tax=Batillaria attramentaria TaxID=370345 RepID=A0ABD0LEL0_9CAEN